MERLDFTDKHYKIVKRLRLLQMKRYKNENHGNVEAFNRLREKLYDIEIDLELHFALRHTGTKGNTTKVKLRRTLEDDGKEVVRITDINNNYHIINL